jgi:cytochrome c oxidase subunit IV
MEDFKLYLIVLISFAVLFCTSLLLELQIFKNYARQSLVICLMLVELFFSFLIFKDQLNKKS